MSTDLPTEEDVLAALLLRYLAIASWPELYDFDHDVAPDYARALCAHRLPPGATRLELEAAIADSERRLEVERARDAVVEAAGRWFDAAAVDIKTDADLSEACWNLRLARAEVSRHGG